MFKIYSENNMFFRGLTHDELKLKEAFCRGFEWDYEVTYPCGKILKCSFIAKSETIIAKNETIVLKSGTEILKSVTNAKNSESISFKCRSRKIFKRLFCNRAYRIAVIVKKTNLSKQSKKFSE